MPLFFKSHFRGYYEYAYFGLSKSKESESHNFINLSKSPYIAFQSSKNFSSVSIDVAMTSDWRPDAAIRVCVQDSTMGAKVWYLFWGVATTPWRRVAESTNPRLSRHIDLCYYMLLNFALYRYVLRKKVNRYLTRCV